MIIKRCCIGVSIVTTSVVSKFVLLPNAASTDCSNDHTILCQHWQRPLGECLHESLLASHLFHWFELIVNIESVSSGFQPCARHVCTINFPFSSLRFFPVM